MSAPEARIASTATTSGSLGAKEVEATRPRVEGRAAAVLEKEVVAQVADQIPELVPKGEAVTLNNRLAEVKLMAGIGQ